jgi:hypothetical protein
MDFTRFILGTVKRSVSSFGGGGAVIEPSIRASINTNAKEAIIRAIPPNASSLSPVRDRFR